MSFPHPGILTFVLSFFDAKVYDRIFSRAVFNYQVIGLSDDSTLVVICVKYTFLNLLFLQHVNCQTLCLGARPRYNLVVDEDVKKPNKQTMLFLTDCVMRCLVSSFMKSVFDCTLPQRIKFLL